MASGAPLPPTVYDFAATSVVSANPAELVYRATKFDPAAGRPRHYLVKRVVAQHYKYLQEPEVAILHRIRKYCVAFFACAETKFSHGGYVYLVIHQGSPRFITLGQYVAAQSYRADSPRTRLIMKRLTELLALLHASGVVHRNICPTSILVDPSTTPAAVKYVDFNRACSVDDEKCLGDPPAVSPPTFMAPEAVDPIRLSLARRIGKWTAFGVAKASDVWSLGMVFYHLASRGRSPWRGTPGRIKSALRAKKAPPLPRVVDLPGGGNRLLPYRALISDMLVVDYAGRATLDHVLGMVEMYEIQKARSARTSPDVERMVDDVTRAMAPLRIRELKSLTEKAGHSRSRLRRSMLGKRRKRTATPAQLPWGGGSLRELKRLKQTVSEYVWPEEKYESPETKYDLPSPSEAKGSPLFGTSLVRSKSREIALLHWYLKLKEKHRRNRAVHLVLGVPGPRDTEVKNYLRHVNSQQLLYSAVVSVHDRAYSNVDYIVSRAVLQSISDGMNDPAVNLVFLRFGIQYLYRPKGGGHANFVVINKRAREIEHYDPWGEGADIPGMTKVVAEFFQVHFRGAPAGYRVQMSQTICPKASMQVIETDEKRFGDYGGFCAVWVLWTIALRLKHPTDDKRTVIRKGILALAAKEPDFTKFIRRFARTIESEYARFDADTGLNIRADQSEITPAQRDKLFRFVKEFLAAGNKFPPRPPQASPSFSSFRLGAPLGVF
uniref:Putative serine/threonine protein kinase n=1 Tax=Marseillevirus LCMAC103 TaxID=2506604 RepID=A0A481YUL4_9VIRU|nr:MAG: putative serine/threonine protein kinase [Marseillevirus LCMAC103]